MSNIKKTMLLLFVDYIICAVVQILGLVFFSWLLKYSWGYPAYSVAACLLLTGLVYVRVHNAATRDVKRKLERNPYAEGIYLALPLAICNLLFIGLFVLLQANIIPLRDVVVKTMYSFPDDAPRVMTEVRVIDYVTPFVRLWFGMAVGFLGEQTQALRLLIVPAVILMGGWLGYVAGIKNFCLSEKLTGMMTKIKNKFNE